MTHEIPIIFARASANGARRPHSPYRMFTHEAVCAERWKETILRIKRIETIMIGTAGTTILLLIGIIVGG